jgi:hypothetical protein
MAGVVYCSWAEPEGRHDAIALWNVRARQLFLAGQEHAALFRRSSWICDYPLMLPSGNAALFTIAGEASFAVTRGTAIEFFLGVPLLGAFLLRQVGLGAWSSFFAVLLLSTPIYWLHGQSQYADIPLAYFVLGAAGVLASALQADEGRRLPLTLAGFFLGCAAWTKNEGALLALVLVMAFTVTLLASPALRGSIGRSLASLALGALVPILDMVAFKRSWAQDTGFSRLVEVTYQDNLRSADRWMGSLIGYGAEMTSWKNWGLTWIVIAICLLTGLVSAPWRRVPLLRFGGLGIVGCAFAWYMVYVLTPFDQKWHIDTSLHRLLLQLQPVLTFVALVYYGSDRDLTSREPRAALTGS